MLTKREKIKQNRLTSMRIGKIIQLFVKVRPEKRRDLWREGFVKEDCLESIFPERGMKWPLLAGSHDLVMR